MNIIDYQIIGDGMPNVLCDKVKTEIKKGWQPVGNAFHMPTITYQTMVKYEAEAFMMPNNEFTSKWEEEMINAQGNLKGEVIGEEPKPKKKGLMKRIFKGDKDE